MCHILAMNVPTLQAPAERTVSEWETRAVDRSLMAVRDRSSERARRLVDAARVLANERGTAEFTVAEVAVRAGVGLRSFYRHFGSRDELLLALFEEEARHGAELLRSALVGVPEPLERLHRYVVGLCDLLVTGSGYSSLLVREYLRVGEQRPQELRGALAPFVGFLEAELGAAADAGAIRPVDHHDAVVLFTTILAHVHARVLLSTPQEGGEASARLWHFCRAALAPSGAEL